VRHVHYQDGETLDALIRLGAHNADKAAHPVRLVQVRHGTQRVRYSTNVRDPHQLSPAGLARLYARRWDIDLAFTLVKRHLGLHLRWSAKPGVVPQQVWAVLTVAQVVQGLRLEIAAAAGVDPFEVSLPPLAHSLPLLWERGDDPVAVFAAGGRRWQFIRPSRRTVIHAPTIPPEDLVVPPPDLPPRRQPRYAERNCGPRAA